MNGKDHFIKAMEIWGDVCQSSLSLAAAQSARWRLDAIGAVVGALDTEDVVRRVLLPTTAFAKAYEQATVAARRR